MGADRFRFEKQWLQQGRLAIAGVDEAGRGPLAGPVVAAAVIFPAEWITGGLPRRLRGLNDSKQLTPEERDRFHRLLTTDPAIRFAIGMSDVAVIDAINILQATHRAMNSALADLVPDPDHVLVDGCPVRSMRHPHTAIVEGDAKSYSIAAASVIAKVTRDRMMIEFDNRFPHYGFAEHKGYATPRHREALQTHGPCEIHRKSFAPVRTAEMDLFDWSKANPGPLAG